MTEQPTGVDVVTASDLLEVARDDVSRHLTELATLLDLVADLVDARQRNFGFLTPDARLAVDEFLREEKAARNSHAHDGRAGDVGLKWLNRDVPSTSVLGESPAPVTIAAASLEAEAWATLWHGVERTTRRLRNRDHDRGWCPYPAVRQLRVARDTAGAPTWPSIDALAAHLRQLVWETTDEQLLVTIERELAHLIGQAETVVDGAGRTHLGECPHCGRDTLVVHFRDRDQVTGTRLGEFVRCGKDPKTGHHERCTCADEWCPCKTSPVTFRHTWWRTTRDAPDPRVAHDWNDLAGRLNIRRATKEPT